MRRRPDLIVPIRDRRRRKRILTLRNFGILMAVLLIAFLAINIRSEMRSLSYSSHGHAIRRAPAQTQTMEVVEEGPPPVRATILVEPAAQRLEPVTTTVNPASMRGRGDVAIIGGAEGVSVVRRERRKPELSGGFGR